MQKYRWPIGPWRLRSPATSVFANHLFLTRGFGAAVSPGFLILQCGIGDSLGPAEDGDRHVLRLLFPALQVGDFRFLLVLGGPNWPQTDPCWSLVAPKKNMQSSNKTNGNHLRLNMQLNLFIMSFAWVPTKRVPSAFLISYKLCFLYGAQNTTQARSAGAWIFEEHRWINVGAGGERQGNKGPSLQHPIFIEDPHKNTCMAHKKQLRTKEPESE